MKLHTYTLVLLLLLTTSCEHGVIIRWYNNACERLTIVVLDRRSQEMDRGVARKCHAVTTGIPLKLRIEHGTGAWYYNAPQVLVPERYWRRKNAMISVIGLQVQPDGSIYVLSPETKDSATNFPPQPTGYPLHPE